MRHDKRDSKGRFMKSSVDPSPKKDPPPKPRKFLSGFAPYTPRMQYETYPLCCGAGIWTGFSNIPVPNDKEIAKHYIDREVKHATQQALNEHHGIITCIVTVGQHRANPYLHDGLIAGGFAPVARSGNPNHNNATNIIVYVKTTGGGNVGLINSNDYNEFMDTTKTLNKLVEGTSPL